MPKMRWRSVHDAPPDTLVGWGEGPQSQPPQRLDSRAFITEV